MSSRGAVLLSFADQLAAAMARAEPTADGATLWSALGVEGVLTGLYSDGAPGAGLDVDRLAAALAAVDGRGSAGATLSFCVQAATSVPMLAEFAATSPVAADLRARMLVGEARVALAATDTGAGSDLSGLSTTVRTEPDGDLVLDGAKRWITSATFADHLLVLARRRPGRHFTCFTWVLVPRSAAGVTVEAADTDLFDGSGVGHLTFDEVRLPGSHLLGRPGLGLPVFARHLVTERLAGALWAVALCRRVIADTKARLDRRTVGDLPLWQSDAVRQRLARCAAEVVKLHALCAQLSHQAAVEHDGVAGALLKSCSGPTVEMVLAECAQLQGADGFAVGGAQRLRAEAAVFSVGGGTTEVVLGMVADHLDVVLRRVAS